VGVLDESDLLMKLHGGAAHFRDPVKTAMTRKPQTLKPSATLKELETVLDSGLVAIVADEQGFHGLITRFDLLNHLRRTLTS
jgi:cystathionine beta-synthase